SGFYPYWGYPYGWGWYGYGYPYYYGVSANLYYDDEGYYGDKRGRRSGNVVTAVQERLANDGYYHGSIDGVIGSGTRRAIRAFEHRNGLPVDGRIDPELLNRMGVG
ncbi:MAG: peptidoglycan-binding protein, partial [Chthoniobacterales bacterium]